MIFERLTARSRSLILRRQEIASLLLRRWGWFSAATFGLGLTFVTYGLAKWKNRQDVVDRKEEYERDIAKAQVETLTAGEIEAKTEAEVALEEAAESASSIPTTDSRERSAALRSRAFEIESRVIKLLHDAFGSSHEVLSQVRVQKGTLVAVLDAVLRPNSPFQVDTVVEIKYLRGPLNVANYVLQAASVSERYASTTDRDSDALLILVIATFEREGSFEEHKRQVKRRIDDARSMLHRTVDVAILHEDELDSITPDEIRRRVRPGLYSREASPD